MGQWLSDHGKETFKQVDFALGATTSVAVLWASHHYGISTSVSLVILLAEAAAAIAVLTVALTALAILVGLLNDIFVRVLEEAGGVGEAMTPYRTVAMISGVTAVVAGVGAAVIGADMNPWWSSIAVAIPSGLTVWSILGTIQITFMTAELGVERANLINGIRAASEALTRIKSQERTAQNG